MSFELTYIAIEQDHHLILDQLAPFNLPNLALLAVEEMTDSEGIIPHEAIDSMPKEYTWTLNDYPSYKSRSNHL